MAELLFELMSICELNLKNDENLVSFAEAACQNLLNYLFGLDDVRIDLLLTLLERYKLLFMSGMPSDQTITTVVSKCFKTDSKIVLQAESKLGLLKYVAECVEFMANPADLISKIDKNTFEQVLDSCLPEIPLAEGSFNLHLLMLGNNL